MGEGVLFFSFSFLCCITAFFIFVAAYSMGQQYLVDVKPFIFYFYFFISGLGVWLLNGEC